jgi:cytochrome c oxidase subunit 2
VFGFEPVMPTFQGLVTEEQLVQLVEYVKSLGPKPGTGRADDSQKPAPKK